MKVLSLFDGMSGARIALDQAGVQVDKYYRSEIDKYANTVADANYPDSIQLGDVRGIYAEEGVLLTEHGADKIDLLVGGSPCQDVSFAGAQKGFADGTRSSLFFEYVRILRTLKPTYFILENVAMKKENMDVITDALGVEPIMINSNLVSAQNRKRFYWTNIPNIQQPADRGIVLADIIEDGLTDRDKAHCIDANYFKGGNLKSYFEKHRRQLVFSHDGLCHVGDADLKGHGYNRRVYHIDGKSPALAAASGGNLEPKILINPANIVGRRLNADGVRKDNDKSLPLMQCLEGQDSDKTRCISTVDKDALLTDMPVGRHPDAYSEAMRLRWRKLTPLEAERLQTVPEGFTAHVSNTQRYRMLGNGFTTQVIAHLLNAIPTENRKAA